MKHILTSIAFFFSLVLAPALAQAGAPIEGSWHTKDAEATIEISVRNGVLTGTLEASTDERAKIGTVILKDFVRDGDGWEGKMRAPKKGRVVDAHLTVKNGKLVIKVSAGMRTKTVTWTRAG